MVGWHRQLHEHEFKQTLGDSKGQGSLACCSPWGRKESDTTEQQTRSCEEKLGKMQAILSLELDFSSLYRRGYSLLESSRHAGSFSNLNLKNPEETRTGWEVLCADLRDRFCVSFPCSLAVLWLVPY